MKNMENKCEAYEDNSGRIYLCILDAYGKCIRIFENWEYGPAGILFNALAVLQEDPDAYYTWEGDLVERLTGYGMDTSAQSLYDDGMGDLIADSTGYINPRMGYAGRKALGI